MKDGKYPNAAVVCPMVAGGQVKFNSAVKVGTQPDKARTILIDVLRSAVIPLVGGNASTDLALGRRTITIEGESFHADWSSWGNRWSPDGEHVHIKGIIRPAEPAKVESPAAEPVKVEPTEPVQQVVTSPATPPVVASIANGAPGMMRTVAPASAFPAK